MYCLPNNYVERVDNNFFDDTGFANDYYQKEVYEHARAIANGFHSVLDIGCGSSFKLVKNFSGFDIQGVDLLPTVEWLRKEYPEHSWQTELPDTAELIIAADVIEHVSDPDDFLQSIKYINPRKIVLSTPERAMLRVLQEDWCEFGPPVNPCHVREWSFAEFEEYVGRFFKVEEHFISNQEQGTQCLVCS